MLQAKSMECWNRPKTTKTHLYAPYKRITSALKTHTGLVREWGKRYSMKGNKNKAGVAILTKAKHFKTRV